MDDWHWTQSYTVAMACVALVAAALCWHFGDRLSAYLCLYLSAPGTLMGLVTGAEWVGRVCRSKREAKIRREMMR
jgi:hypothetical protein